MDDIETLQSLCATVQRVPVFVMPDDRDAFDRAWKEYEAKRSEVRLQVGAKARDAGLYNPAAVLAVVNDKLGYAP